MSEIILASKSPRRKALLEQIGISFRCHVEEVDETLDTSIPVDKAIEHIARKKAKVIAKQHANAIVIGADTMVCYRGHVLGKPKNKEDAMRILKMLSGKKHEVITGVAILYKGKEIIWHNRSEVTFYPLTEKEIIDYVASGEPLDKAGAYAIQGKGAKFVAKIRGDYYNIVGLPVAQVYRELEKLKEEADIV